MQPTVIPQVQQIPVSKIRPNPNNPRHVITPDIVENLSISMMEAGLKNPVKLQKLKEADNGAEFELISGHIRFEAAKKLGWEMIPAFVLDLTTEQAELVALLDNKAEEMHWLDWYQAIEKRLIAPSQPTQQQIAAELGLTQPIISRAKRLMEVLSTSARAQIYNRVIKMDGYSVPEKAVFPLTSLEKSEIVEKALKVVMDHQMTEPETAKLVTWVLKTGHDPEEYTSHQGSPTKPEDTLTDLWKPLPPRVKVSKSPQGYRVVMNLSPAEAPTAVYGAMSWLERLKEAAHVGTPDLQYQQALSGLLDQGAKGLADEEAEKQQIAEGFRLETEKKAKAKAEARVRKQEADLAKGKARLESASQKENQKAQAKREIHGSMEAMKTLLKMKVEENLGPGSLADMACKIAENGQKAKALNLYGDGLAHLGKTEAEKQELLGEVEDTVQQILDLKKQLGALKPASRPVKSKEPLAQDAKDGGQPIGAEGSALSTAPTQHDESRTQTAGVQPVPEAVQTQSDKDEVMTEGSKEMNPTSKPGVLNQVKKAVQENLDLTPGGIAGGLVKDLKQAANYEIRKGMRNALKDLL